MNKTLVKLAECSLSETELFEPPFVQSVIESSQIDDIYPVNSLTDGGAIELNLSNASDQFIDLAHSYMQVKLRIVNVDGSPIQDTAKVGLVNNALSSLFAQVDVSLGGRLISSATRTHPYRAMFETLLIFSGEARKSQLAMQLMTKDTAGAMDSGDPDGDNKGFKERFIATQGGKLVELRGRLHGDIFASSRLILSGLSLKVVLHRAKDEFVLISSDEQANYKIQLLDVVFKVRKVILTSSHFLSIQRKLTTQSALYPIDRVVVKNYSIPQNLNHVSWDHCITGRLPTRVFVAFVDNAAFSGNYTRNPYNFKNYDIRSLACMVDNKSCPGRPMKFNFNDRNIQDGYLSLFSSTNRMFLDEGLDITMQDYINGYTICGFQLSPACSQTGHAEPKREGDVRLVIEFGTALPTAVTILLYAEFDACLSVDKSRNVLLDF